MNNILNDGYYVPKDRDLLKKFIDNMNFDYDQWAAERQDSILTQEQLDKYRETKQIINEACRTLKVSADQLVDKVKSIKEENKKLTEELTVSSK